MPGKLLVIRLREIGKSFLAARTSLWAFAFTSQQQCTKEYCESCHETQFVFHHRTIFYLPWLNISLLELFYETVSIGILWHIVVYSAYLLRRCLVVNNKGVRFPLKHAAFSLENFMAFLWQVFCWKRLSYSY